MFNNCTTSYCTFELSSVLAPIFSFETFVCLRLRLLGGAIGLSGSIEIVPLFKDFVLAITSGSLKALNGSIGTMGLSSQETGVDGSDDLVSDDGRKADSFPKSHFN